MEDRELLLERIDRHLDENRQATSDLRLAINEQRQAIDEQRQAIDDLRQALNQMNLRQERIMGQVLAELRRLGESIQAMNESIREQRAEFLEESRAGRTALFAILDRLGPGPAAAGA